MRDIEKTISNLIDKVNVSIISSVDEEGYPNTKAMLKVRKREGIKRFYFTTNTSSLRTQQYLKNAKACIYFFDPRFVRGVMLIGTMEVLQDHETKESIWRFGDTLYYRQGIDDPDYSVLRFTATSGRYYANFKTESFTVE